MNFGKAHEKVIPQATANGCLFYRLPFIVVDFCSAAGVREGERHILSLADFLAAVPQ